MKDDMSRKGIIKKKVRCTIATIAVLSAVGLSVKLAGDCVIYGTIFDDYSQPDRVYEQDDFVPAGYFNEHPIKVAVSNDFRDDEFAEIKGGIAELDECAEGLKFEIVRTSKKTRRKGEQIIILKDLNNKYVENTKNGIAYYNIDRNSPESYKGAIYLSKNIPIYVVHKITAHEILHVLGFEHERDYKSVMYYRSSTINTKFTKKDIEKINKKFPAKESDEEELTV